MIEEILSLYQNIVKNPILGSAVSMMVAGSVLYFLKSLPAALFESVLNQITTSVRITNDNISFYKLLEWFESSEYKKYSRILSVTNGKWGYSSNPVISAGTGTHYFIYNKKICRMTLTRTESPSEKVKEEITITYFGRNIALVDDIISEIFVDPNVEKSSYKVLNYVDSWQEETSEPYRHFDTIFLGDATKEKLFSHIEKFLSSKEDYIKKGIPYRTTILLHGLS